jgi:DNA-binding NarL/FixJ family response regulator
MSVRILLADDHALVRAGLRRIIEGEHGLEVVAEASDGVEAVEVARATPFDLAVLDVSMPRMTGLQAAREITRRVPDAKVLMLSMHENEQYFFSALQAGASGYVPKSAADEDLVEACRAAMRGEPFLYAGVASTLVRDFLERMRRGERMPRSVLTAREEEVVKLIAEGNSSKEIASALVIAVRPWNGTGRTCWPSSGCATAPS